MDWYKFLLNIEMMLKSSGQSLQLAIFSEIIAVVMQCLITEKVDDNYAHIFVSNMIICITPHSMIVIL